MKKIIFITIFLPISCQQNEMIENSANEEIINKLEKNELPYIEKYENGQIKIKTFNKDKKYHGEYVELYKNGNLKEKGVMSKGLKTGVWKTYYEDGDLKEVNQYNKGELTFKLDKYDFIFDTLFIDSNKIKILSPTNWESKSSNGTLLYYSRKRCNDSVSFCPNITIAKEKIREGLKFNDYIDINIELLESQSSFIRIIKKYEFTLNGLPSYQTSYLLEENGIGLGALSTWIKVDDVSYVITGIAMNGKEGEFLKYRGLFREIALSFLVIH